MEGQLQELREKPERGNDGTQQEWEGPDDRRRDQEIRCDFPRTSKPGAREDRGFCSITHLEAVYMEQEHTACPTCKSADTMSTETTWARDTRHCFGCRRSFDIEFSSPPTERLRREDRSDAFLSERRRRLEPVHN